MDKEFGMIKIYFLNSKGNANAVMISVESEDDSIEIKDLVNEILKVQASNDICKITSMQQIFELAET